MKKATKFAALLLTAAMAFTMTACSDKKDTDKAEKSNSEDQFIVGFDAEYPPYGYKDDNGEYVGFDLDLAEEVCKRNGWELVKQPID